MTTETSQNETAEHVVYTYTVPAGKLGASDGIRVRLFGTYLNDSGAQRTVVIGVKLGGTTLYSDTTTTLAASASTRAVFLDVQLFNAGSTSSQKLGGRVSISAAGTTAAGYGELADRQGNSLGLDEPIYGTSAVDTTVDQTFEITVQHATAASTIVFTRQLATTELLK